MRMIVLAAGLVLTAPDSVGAADICAAAQASREALTSAGLTLVGRGLSYSGALIEIYASAIAGTFAALTVLPSGVACVSAIGTDWTPSPAGTPT